MKKVAITLGTVCFVLTMAICIQMKTVKSLTGEGNSLSYSSELINEVLKRRQEYKDLYKKLEYKELILENARNNASTKNNTDTETENKIKQYNKLLGLTDVKGSGVIITIDDNRDVTDTEVLVIKDLVAHNTDLLNIVNELFNTEADAISINDKRIVSTSSIFCDGTVIRVNGEIVGVPIVIKAIGHPERLYYNVADRTGGYLRYMALRGLKVNIEKSDEITIKKYEGVYQHEFIK